MTEPGKLPSVTKLATGIDGFDHIGLGGIPAGRTTLVAGTAGSAKTIFAAQFLRPAPSHRARMARH
jgi:circadian clock protein KaiC|nr:ATPase domain-containing protein [uncultured Thiodictyon sp.]